MQLPHARILTVSHQAEPTPKTMNGNALKVVRSASRAYETLGDLYLAAHDRLQAEVEAGATLWSEVRSFPLISRWRERPMFRKRVTLIF